MAYALDNLRILIVDDSAHVRTLLRTILQTVGVREIDLAADGVSGFDTFCRREYDVLFTDYEMEPMSGLDFVDLVRTSRKSPNPYIPIIMISAYSDRERVTKARDHGVTEFLAKPFTVERLLRRLETVIESPRPFVRTGSYFGPDRRRKVDLAYTGPERRHSVLDQVRLSSRDMTEQQRSALEGARANVDRLLRK